MLRKRDINRGVLREEKIRTPVVLRNDEEDDRFIYVKIILAVLVFLVIIPFFLTQSDVHPFGVNNLTKIDLTYERMINEGRTSSWRDVSIFKRRSVLESQKPYRNDNHGCVQRHVYNIELTRLFGADPYHEDLSVGSALVIGSDTPVGSQIVRKLHGKVRGIKCDEYLDFGDASSLLHHFNFTHSYVTCQQRIPKGANTFVHTSVRRRYIERMNKTFAALNDAKISTTFVHSLPHDPKIVSLAKGYGAQVVVVPELLDNANIYGKTVQECLQYGFSTVELAKYNSPSQYKAQQVAEYIIENITKGTMKDISFVEGQDIYKPEAVAANSVKHIYPCDLKTMNSERESADVNEGEKISINAPSNAVNRFVRELRALKRISIEVPYVSIIVPIMDDVSEASFKRFIASIEEGITLYPLANIEVIVVETGKPIHESITLSKHMKRFVKFYRIDKPDRECNFEAVIRDTAGEAAKGEFLLFTKPNVIFSPSIFFLIGERSFNNGIFYTAPIYSGTFDILDSFNTKDLDNLRLSVNDGLKPEYGVTEGLSFISNAESIIESMNTSIEYFHLASKELFSAIGYYPQSSDMCIRDVYLNAMRLISGSCTMSIPYGIAVETSESGIKTNEKCASVEDIKKIVCNGDIYSVYKTKAFFLLPKLKSVKI